MESIDLYFELAEATDFHALLEMLKEKIAFYENSKKSELSKKYIKSLCLCVIIQDSLKEKTKEQIKAELNFLKSVKSKEIGKKN